MFRERIRDNYEHFSPGFRRLADFIVDHTLDAALITATELGRRTDVDPATVVRFAQDLGYSGFRELSSEIRRYVQNRFTTAEGSTETQPTQRQRFATRLADFRQQLDYLTSVDLDRLAEIGAALNTAQAVWIVAEGPVADLARGFAYHLLNTGLTTAVFQPDLLEAAMRLSHMQTGDALLALGGDGPQIDEGHVVSLAREKGVKTLCISSRGLSRAAQESDIALILPQSTEASPLHVALVGALLFLVVDYLEIQRAEDKQKHRDAQQQLLECLVKLHSEGSRLPQLSTAIWSRQLGWTSIDSDS